jgi:hypothetical protein
MKVLFAVTIWSVETNGLMTDNHMRIMVAGWGVLVRIVRTDVSQKTATAASICTECDLIVWQ